MKRRILDRIIPKNYFSPDEVLALLKNIKELRSCHIEIVNQSNDSFDILINDDVYSITTL